MKQKISSKNKSTCAIICEFNPMHTGHIFLINKAKELTNSDYMIGIMSGNFSQRSEICVLDKYTRSEIATHNGLDLIINLPTCFCTNNAEVFALSSIKILNQIGLNFLAFGVETLNINAFFTLAKFMIDEPKEFKTKLKENLNTGLSYFNAYTKTIKENSSFFDNNMISDLVKILTRPNNTLALEYVKALIKTNSKIKPIFIQRVDNYNLNGIKENYVSANYIRKNLIENFFEKVSQFLPRNSHIFFKENLQKYSEIFDIKKPIVNANKLLSKTSKKSDNKTYNEYQIPNILKTLILYKIKSLNLNELKKIYSVSEGLENKIKNSAKQTNCFDVFYQSLITKRYKQNKINSILLNCLLEIDKETINKLYTIKNNIYAKILAINPKKREILSVINTKYLICRKKDIENAKLNSFNKKLVEIENTANIVYNLIFNTHLNENDWYNKTRL